MRLLWCLGWFSFGVLGQAVVISITGGVPAWRGLWADFCDLPLFRFVGFSVRVWRGRGF